MVINGTHAALIELGNCARATLRYGYHVLDRIAHSEDVLRLFLDASNDDGQASGISVRLGQGYGWLGEFMRGRGNVEGAGHMIGKAMTIFESLDHQPGIAATSNSMGIIETIRGKPNTAEALSRRALELSTDLGDFEGVANAYGNLGQVAHARGDLENAELLHPRRA